MKELFNEDGRLNEEGRKVAITIEDLLRHFYSKQIDEGCRHQDIEILIVRTAQDLTLNNILGF